MNEQKYLYIIYYILSIVLGVSGGVNLIFGEFVFGIMASVCSVGCLVFGIVFHLRWRKVQND